MIPGHFYWDLKGIDKPEELFDQYDDNSFMIDEQYGMQYTPALKSPSNTSNRNKNNPSAFMGVGDSFAMHHLGPANKPLFSLALKIPGNPNPPPGECANID